LSEKGTLFMSVIDLHCHLLPGVDDGARDFSVTEEMLAAAARCGVTDIAATPHLTQPEQLADLEKYRRLLEETRERASSRGIRVHRGFEVNYRMFSGMDFSFLRDVCLGDTPYFLLELPGRRLFPNWDVVLSKLALSGYRPIIAHPERYAYVQEDPAIVEEFLSFGCRLQVDAGGLFGGLFSTERLTAANLLKKGAVHFIASDAHAPETYRILDRALRKFSDQLAVPARKGDAGKRGGTPFSH
jgi:protein-tyrosine phosphatase